MRSLLRCVALSGLLACGPAWAQFNLLSDQEARRLGAESHKAAVAEHGGIYEDPGIGGYVALVGGRLVLNTEMAKSEFNFSVLDSPILNAFATPGYVHITRGLLAIFNSEDELASVLGHEIGHVTARHVEQSQSVATVGGIGLSVLSAVLGSSNLDPLLGLGANLGMASFSRGHETEADGLGLRYMARAGYNPRAGAIAMESLETAADLEMRLAGANAPSVIDSFFATHPRSPERVGNLLAQARQSGLPLDRPLLREAYLRAIDGMIWGNGTQQGIVRGREFMHPGLRVAFSFPEGFSISNKQKAVSATDKAGAAIRADIAAPKRSAEVHDYLSREWAPNLRLGQVERIQVNGMPAATGAARVESERGTMDVRLVGIQYAPDRIFRFLFVTPTAETARNTTAFQRMTYSFRRIGAQEAAAVRPLRIRLVQVRPGDTTATLSQRMQVPTAKQEHFETMNGLKPGEPLRPGELIKIVAP